MGLYFPAAFVMPGKILAEETEGCRKHFFGQAHNISKYAEGFGMRFPGEKAVKSMCAYCADTQPDAERGIVA